MRAAMRDAVKKSKVNKKAAKDSKTRWKESSKRKRVVRSYIILASLIPVLILGVLYCLHTFGYIRLFGPRPLSKALANPQMTEELDLTHYYLEAIPQDIGKLQKLKSLTLESNKIASWDPVLFKLTSLKKLNLSYNKLKEIPPGIKALSSLQALSLDGNQISSLPKEISGLESLQYLSLTANGLTNLPAEIGKLKGLKVLILNSNQLSQLPDSLGKLKSLEKLSLAGNPLTTIPDLSGLKKLKSISLRGTNLSPGEIKNLKKRFGKGVTINS